MHELLAQSLSIIASGQSASGAYIASPTYPTYNYCWFRDGTFIAYAMDLWQKHESARRFYDWATAAVTAPAEALGRLPAEHAPDRHLRPCGLLHTPRNPS